MRFDRVLTLSSSEGQHGGLALSCSATGHHQNLVQAGRLQIGQGQRLFAARHSHRMPTTHHVPHVVHLRSKKQRRSEGTI